MRSIAITLVIVLVVSLLPLPLGADSRTGSLILSANPPFITADGKSFTTITAEVKDSDGKFAPDDAEIHFAASLGEIEETGKVQAGSARVKLTSANLPGTCTVTATWVDGQAVSRLNVVFGEHRDVPKGPEYIDVEASDYLAYSVDHQTLEAIGNVRLRYRSLELEAKSVQVDLARSKIIAKGEGRANPVKLISKSGVTEASIFTCDFSASQGLILSAERGKIQQVSITSEGWSLGAEQSLYLPDEFDFKDLSDSGILVKAKQATIFPNEKIQFHRTNVYVDGKRMLTLPLYVLSLTGYQENGEQYLGYGTNGITLNLPFYYGLSPMSSGAVLIRHGEATGWGEANQSPGWFVDLRQRYATNKSQGMITLNHVTDRWGAQFNHTQQIGKNGSAYIYLDYPAHQSLYGNLSLTKSVGDITFGANMSGSDYRTSVTIPETNELVRTDSITQFSSVYAQTRSAPMGKMPLKYTVSARAEQSRVGDTTNDSKGTRSSMRTSSTQHLDGNLYTNPILLTKSISLRGSTSLGYLFGDPALAGTSVLGNAVMSWKLSKLNDMQVSYRYTSRPSVRYEDPNPKDGIPESVQIRERSGSQALSASLRLGDGNRWSANLFALEGLNYTSSSIFGDFSYRLSKEWRFMAHATANMYEITHIVYDVPGDLTSARQVRDIRRFNDVELGIGKMFGSREVRAVWSSDDSRVMLELGSGGF
jgi:hypothetical protein